MKMKKLSAFMVLIMFCGFGLAQLGIPHQFYGSVDFINGPAPDGLSVEAWVDGVSVAESVTLNGEYGFAPEMFFVTDPYNDRDGKNVSFYVDGVDTGEVAVFVNGATSKLDLSVPASLPVVTPTTLPSYGGGGRSSGGSSGSGGGSVVASPKISCFDGIQNQGEEEIDCGGPCDPCISCSDGIQNQGEEGIDCGGPCDPCPTTTTSASTSTTMQDASSTSTTAPVTSTIVGATTSTTVAAPAATGNVLEEIGGPVSLVVLLFFLVFLVYRLQKRGKL